MRIKDRELTKEEVTRIADSHIRRFENMLASSNPYVRKDECEKYLAIWKSTKIKVEKEEPLDGSENKELIEAIYSGDYDDLLDPPDTERAT